MSDQDLANHPSVILYDDLTDLATLRSRYWVQPWRDGPGVLGPLPWPARSVEFVPIPEYGLTALRCTAGESPHILDAFRWCQPVDSPPMRGAPWKRPYVAGQSLGYDEMYLRYVVRVDSRWKMGAWQAMKLPGLTGRYEMSPPSGPADTRPTPADWACWEHRMGIPAPKEAAKTGGRLRLFVRMNDVDWPFANHPWNNVGAHPNDEQPVWTDGYLELDRLHCIEQYIKLNTIAPSGEPNRNGVVQVDLDGQRVLNVTNRRIRGLPHVQIQCLPYLIVYHGGVGRPTGPFYIDIAGVVVSTERVGPPKLIAAPEPQPQPENEMATIETVITKQTEALNEAYAVAGQPSVAQQLADATAALATANANIATLNTKLTDAISLAQAAIAADTVDDAAETARFNALLAKLQS